MNLEAFPDEIKKDIEDQSLSILSNISELFIVIGGWAVRAIVGKEHGRYTLDIDGVATDENIRSISEKLTRSGMSLRENEWGFQC